MNRTILIIIGLLCAVITTAGIMCDHPFYVTRQQLHDKDPNVRAMAIHKLGDLNDQKSIPDAIKLLLDDSGFVRMHALYALDVLNVRESIQAIIKLLQDKDPMVRWYAIKVLGTLGAQDAIPQITEILNNQNLTWFHEEAEIALRKLGVPEVEIEQAR